MSNFPFSLSKRQDSPFYYVRFKNESTGEYLPAKSTRQTEKRQAQKVAWEWFKSGQIGSQKKEKLDNLIFQNEIKKADEETLKLVIQELKNRGTIKAVVYKDSESSVMASQFLLDFWTWDKSQYVAEKKRKNHSIGKRHCSKQIGNVKNYWFDFLQNKTLGELTKKDINSFVDMIADTDKSFCAKNDIIRAGTTAFKWAKTKGLIETDLFSNIIFFSGQNKPREILTPELAEAVFRVSWNNDRAKLANMLAMCTGLRAGEIQALRLKDLGRDRLYINHSWNFQDGLKSTKNGETRTVYLPFPQIINALKELAEANPYKQGLDGFVFWASIPEKPMEAKIWLTELRQALKNIGVAESNKYTFHSWRHYYSSYMIERVNQKILQKQTGHKTMAMLEHYADHEIKGDIELVENAQIQQFGGIVRNADRFNFNFEKMNKYIQVEYKEV